MKCDHCNNPATVHLTEIINGEKMEKHLCEQCAANEGITVKSNVPISQLLEDFVLHSPASQTPEPTCEVCGLSFGEFRNKGLLGCAHDYDVFESQLEGILERAHEGVTQHVGKVPRRTGTDQKKVMALLRMRAQLRTAIAAEDYEQAAELRDQIKRREAQL
jgi:protein arginine kinase activator